MQHCETQYELLQSDKCSHVNSVRQRESRQQNMFLALITPASLTVAFKTLYEKEREGDHLTGVEITRGNASGNAGGVTRPFGFTRRHERARALFSLICTRQIRSPIRQVHGYVPLEEITNDTSDAFSDVPDTVTNAAPISRTLSLLSRRPCNYSEILLT